MADEKQSDLIHVCGLWSNKSQGGGKYLSGSLGFAKILIFANTRKEEGSNQPDYRMCIAERPRKDDATDTPQVNAPVAEDDLPF